MRRSISPSLGGLLCLAWLALAPFALVGCGSTVPPAEPAAPAAGAEPAPGGLSPNVAAPGPRPLPHAAPAAPAPHLLPPGVTAPKVAALLLPLSGPHAALGEALRDAAFLALAELAGPDLVLLPRDSAGTAEGARRAAEQALAEGAQLILGPLFRDAVLGAAGPARARGVPVVAFSTDRAVAGDGVYLLGFTPDQQVARVLRFAAGRGVSRFAALAPDSPYGHAVVQQMQTTLAALGLASTAIQFYAADGEGAAEAVQRLGEFEARRGRLSARRAELAAIGDAEARRELRGLAKAETYGELPFEALLLPEGGEVLRRVAPLLPYYDVDGVRLLGTGLWDDPALAREREIAGGWYAAPPPALAEDFRRRFEAAYGRLPPRIASLAYDAAALATVLAAAGPGFDAGLLNAASGFAGSDGIFRFGPDGVAQRGLAVLEVDPAGAKVVDPAPTTFEGLSAEARPGS